MADGDDGEERDGARRRALRERLEALRGIEGELSPAQVEELKAVWPAVWDAHAKRVWNLFSRRGLDRSTVQDLRQETFEKARLEMYEHGVPYDIGAYLHKIGVGKLLNHLRRQRNCPFSVGLPSSGSEPPQSKEEMVRDLDRKAFHELLREKLSEDHLAIAQLHLVSQLTVEQCAEVLDIPLGTASSRLRRAKEVIAKLLRRWVPPSKRQGNG